MKKISELNLFNKEINSHEETKRNETKGLLLSLINNHFKTFLITLLSLTLLFLISCSNEGTTGGGGNDGADSVPTFTGKPATDLADGYYQGTLYYKSHHISEFYYPGLTEEKFVGADGIDIISDKTFYLKIANNKLKWEEYEQGIEDEKTIEKEALKSGSEYGATIEYENNEQGSAKERKTIKFTISGDTISITYFEGQSVDMKQVDDGDGNKIDVKYSYDATYGGALDKYTPTTTP